MQLQESQSVTRRIRHLNDHHGLLHHSDEHFDFNGTSPPASLIAYDDLESADARQEWIGGIYRGLQRGVVGRNAMQKLKEAQEDGKWIIYHYWVSFRQRKYSPHLSMTPCLSESLCQCLFRTNSIYTCPIPPSNRLMPHPPPSPASAYSSPSSSHPNFPNPSSRPLQSLSAPPYSPQPDKSRK